MEAMLQRHCARYIYVIPDGLRELMSDISREVLRSQPEDVYTFIADYLDALMITRENARVAARLVESLTEMATTTAIFLEETGMPRDEVDTIVSAIQKTFKKSIDSEESGKVQSEDTEEVNIVTDILNEIQVTPEQAEIAAIVIQQAYRRFKERKEREKLLLSGLVDWRVAARSAIHLYRKTGVSNEEANRAATLIKSAYKGYYTRKILKRMAAVNGEDFLQDIDFKHVAYLEAQEEGGEAELLEDDEQADEKQKSVTIDYNTVIPHVDFDTSGLKLDVSEVAVAPKLSAASSIAKYSLRYIFDTALDRIGKQSAIVEESEEENEANTSDFSERHEPGSTESALKLEPFPNTNEVKSGGSVETEETKQETPGVEQKS